MEAGWEEVGAAPTTPVVTPTTIGLLNIPNPTEDRNYDRITRELQTWHKELLALESEGKLSNIVENPVTASDYLARLRLNVNMLFAFTNNYIEVLNDLQRDLALKRQTLYQERLAMPKGSPSAAETHSREMTRIDEANVKQVENRIQQIRNDYERYNGICLFLHSKMKEVNTERIMG